MTEEGPQLESLTHRLAECPPEFLLAPRVGGRDTGTMDVFALVCDHFRAIGAPVPKATAASLITGSTPAVVPNRLRLTAVATWLLRDPWFLARKDLADRTWGMFTKSLAEPAALLKAESAVTDPDRREEFVRLCLRQLQLRPKGETIAQATDRFNSLDSVEREKVIRKTRDAEKRAREVREQMAKRAAEEAAAKSTRE